MFLCCHQNCLYASEDFQSTGRFRVGKWKNALNAMIYNHALFKILSIVFNQKWFKFCFNYKVKKNCIIIICLNYLKMKILNVKHTPLIYVKPLKLVEIKVLPSSYF